MNSSKYYSDNIGYNDGVGNIYIDPLSSNSGNPDGTTVNLMSANNLSRTQRTKTLYVNPVTNITGISLDFLVTQSASNAIIRLSLMSILNVNNKWIKLISTENSPINTNADDAYDIIYTFNEELDPKDVCITFITNGNVISAEMSKCHIPSGSENDYYPEVFNSDTFNNYNNGYYAQLVPEFPQDGSFFNIPMSSTNASAPEDVYLIYPTHKWNPYDVTLGTINNLFTIASYYNQNDTNAFDEISIISTGGVDTVTVGNGDFYLLDGLGDYGRITGVNAVTFKLGAADITSNVTNSSILTVTTAVINNSTDKLVDTDFSDNIYNGCAQIRILFRASNESAYISGLDNISFREDGTNGNSHVASVDVESNIGWTILGTQLS